MLQNKPLVRQGVLVIIPGLDWTTQRAHRADMPFMENTLKAPAVCLIDDGKATYSSSMERLLTVPQTKTGRKRSKQKANAPEPPPQPPSFYCITLDMMKQLSYPLPVCPVTVTVWQWLRCRFC
jgi:hypothetical protein